jgi:hypothetical protein
MLVPLCSHMSNNPPPPFNPGPGPGLIWGLWHTPPDRRGLWHTRPKG